MRLNLPTFGTAAWKLISLAVFSPVTWKRAKIFTTPALWGETWGVSDILSSFSSYTTYDCSFGAAGTTGWGGGDWTGENNEDESGTEVEAGTGDGVDVDDPNNPRISLTELFWGCVELDVVGVLEADVGLGPKISASKAWLFWTTGDWTDGLLAIEVSSPSRSIYIKRWEHED